MVRFPNIQLSPSKFVTFTKFSKGVNTLLLGGNVWDDGFGVGFVVGNLQKPS